MRYGPGIQADDVWRQWTTWIVHCCNKGKCASREERRWGHCNFYSMSTKAGFAKELTKDGWRYQGNNRWACPRCTGKERP